MKEIRDFNVKKLNVFYLFILVLLSACLPQEKTTQCGENEAYDSTRRKCVATLGTSDGSVNITNVTPSNSYSISSSDTVKTHTVTISDPYSNGYQVRWNLTHPSGTTTLLGTGLSITFNHTSYATGTYIIEVQLLSEDGTSVYDSRSWTVNIIDENVPSISAVTATPFSTTITSASTTITATATNPDAIANVNYQWYVNGSAISGYSGTFSTTSQALSFPFDPTSSASYYAGSGVYTVQLILSENSTGSTYNYFTWTITNGLPNFANASLGSSSALSTNTPTQASIITTISGLNIGSGGFLYDVDGDANLDSIDFCVSVDNVTGVDGDGVFVDFLIDGTNIPSATGQQLVSNGTDYCLQDFNNYSYTIPSNIVAESHTISAVVYDGYQGATNLSKYNGYTQIKAFTWTIRVRQPNTAPSITIDDSNTGTGGNISCSTQTTTTYSACTVTQTTDGTSFRLAINVSDDDYAPNDYTVGGEYGKFRVQYYLDGTLIDGSIPLTSADCYQDFGETQSASRYYCDISLLPYDTDGPINVSGLSYVITAKVTDEDSPYSSTTADSNTLTWLITTVNDSNSGTGVNQFAVDDASHTSNPTYSWISNTATPSTALTLSSSGVSEGDTILFHVSVDDEERDSHTIKLEKCDDSTCNSVEYPPVASYIASSTDDTNPRISSISHTIEEDEIEGAASGTAYYLVTVTDSDGASAQTSVGLQVTNTNPDPTWDDTTFSPALTDTLITFTGFPITIDAGTISDASLLDGVNPTYQWMYSEDAGANWAPIPGATSKTLVWSPDANLAFLDEDGADVEFKLCLGDDGVDNSGASKDAMNAAETDCYNAALDTSTDGTWTVTVFSNMTQGRTYLEDTTVNTSLDEIATWIDPTSTDPMVKYMAYVNQGREIIVEKILLNSDGTRFGSTQKTASELYSISFDASTYTNFASNPVTNLSLAGDSVNGALYLAYMAPDATGSLVHIRRIDISGGKTGLSHEGKFGWDSGYNDLTDNITISSSGISAASVNSDGQTEITFTDASDNTTMTVQFTIMGNTVNFVGGSEFCTSTCSTSTATATDFAAAINASTSPVLQGLTATATGSLVTLEGIVEGDYIEADLRATTIGSIMVNQTTGSWQLPYIDNSLMSPDTDKISLFEGDLGVRLVDSNMGKQKLAATVASQEVANDLDANGKMIIATKAKVTGNIALYEVNTSYAIIDSDTDLFGVTTVTNLKVAVSKEDTDFDPSAFIIGININNRFAYARVDSISGNYDFGNLYATPELDSGFSMQTGVTNYDITAGNNEYQLLIAAALDVDADSNYEAYLLSVTGDTPSIDCSYDNADAQNSAKCMQIQTGTNNVFNMKLSLSEVLKGFTIGTDGATANESTADVIALAYHIDDGGGSESVDALPILGVLNITGYEPSADETSPGSGYSLPYVKP